MYNCNNISIYNNIFISGTNECKNVNLVEFNYWDTVIVNDSIYLPLDKPPIKNIDSIDLCIEIIYKKTIKTPAYYNEKDSSIIPVSNLSNLITTGRKLIIEGLLLVTISYISATIEECLYTFNTYIPFSSSIDISRYADYHNSLDSIETNFLINNYIESFKVLSVSSHTLSFYSSILLHAIPNGAHSKSSICNSSLLSNNGCNRSKVVSLYENILIKGISSNKTIESIINSCEDNLWTLFNLPEIINQPTNKPIIKDIISFSCKLDISNCRIINTPETLINNYEGITLSGKKLLINGILRQKITYTSDSISNKNSIYVANFDIPVTTFIIIPNCCNNIDNFKVDYCIENIFICKLYKYSFYKDINIFIKVSIIYNN